MENSPSLKINRMSIWAGIFTGACLIVFFLIMRFLKLHYIVELRYLNFVFITAGIAYTLSHAKKISGSLEYLEGLALGFKISYIAVTIFSVFIAGYLYVIDPGFMAFIKHHAHLGIYINPWILAGVIFGEGLGSGLIITLILLQYYKAGVSEEKN